MKKASVFALMVVLVVSAGAAYAGTTLNPGAVDYKPSYGAPAYTYSALPAYMISGNIIGIPLVSNYVGGFTGTITSTVYKNPANNNLTFAYVWTNAGAGDVTHSTIGDPTWKPWQGWTISDCGSDASGSSTAAGSPSWTDGAPFYLERDPTVSGEGLTIVWRSGGNGTVLRGPSNTSAKIWFETNAQAYQTTNVGVLDTGIVSSAEAYCPLSLTIPEPATISLLGLGLLALIRRRR